MRALLLILIGLTMISPARATIITVTYTGMATGNWFGNYDPTQEPQISSVNAGSFPSASFTASFVYDLNDSLLHQNGQTNLTRAMQISPFDYSGIELATFSGALFFKSNGSSFIQDLVSPGHTYQAFEGQPAYHTSTASIYVNAYSNSIPSSVFTPFHGIVTGSGTATLNYNVSAYGGGFANFDLSISSLDVSINPPVPELSTWAMLLIGFAGVGFSAYRRQKLYPFAAL
jgi:hypothetical protein